MLSRWNSRLIFRWRFIAILHIRGKTFTVVLLPRSVFSDEISEYRSLENCFFYNGYSLRLRGRILATQPPNTRNTMHHGLSSKTIRVLGCPRIELSPIVRYVLHKQPARVTPQGGLFVNRVQY